MRVAIEAGWTMSGKSAARGLRSPSSPSSVAAQAERGEQCQDHRRRRGHALLYCESLVFAVHLLDNINNAGKCFHVAEPVADFIAINELSQTSIVA